MIYFIVGTSIAILSRQGIPQMIFRIFRELVLIFIGDIL
jgi:hypothetical protein